MCVKFLQNTLSWPTPMKMVLIVCELAKASSREREKEKKKENKTGLWVKKETERAANKHPASENSTQPRWNANQLPCKCQTSPRGPRRKDPLCASVFHAFAWRRKRIPANLMIGIEIIQENKQDNRGSIQQICRSKQLLTWTPWHRAANTDSLKSLSEVHVSGWRWRESSSRICGEDTRTFQIRRGRYFNLHIQRPRSEYNTNEQYVLYTAWSRMQQWRVTWPHYVSFNERCHKK